MNRRELLKFTAAAFAAPTTLGSLVTPQGVSEPSDDRALWVDTLRRLANPVLEHLANETLRTRMPVEQAIGADRRNVTHLEALGRLIAGIAPWIELPGDSTAEGQLRTHYAALACRAIDRAVEPSSPDYLNFTRDKQPLVDAAFLGQGVIRARRALRDNLEPRTVRNLVVALESTRAIAPPFNNWLLFSAMIEATLATLGARWDRMRIDYALRQHEQWYKGDGTYGDGPSFHWDYYNSFVIQPMMIDVLDVCRDEMPVWKDLASRVEKRARRYAAILERLIAPDGSFPAIGRSLAYRFGAFHLLAQMALRHALPHKVSPAQVRGALTAVIRRTMRAPHTFDADGWLRIGFCGHQPRVGEPYISTGSLYLCAVGLLPLGLAPTDEFWSAQTEPWTSVRAWSGQGFAIDRALPT
ncbi:hypothetical protein MELA_00160 [Candidatus Methylomirabilis lanthanidiphila]|uniref:DUF2264 domain-containing protein n=1 Tax=Candidatus Methylomirabilis lanthanidiphila TaxID=2211376 RepID=A0A564ZGM5_9BACT|nr:DUF2264 domain-containing protein [Candidatus Methylomirabilis lanthanidiphila]VUZ83802.1 hypothetical protein MELA_00160 [Candidatus Methylomirabilis lanthanidiphila]